MADNYNTASFDRAIDLLLPTIKKAKEDGIQFAKPELCKMVASKMFIMGDIEKRHLVNY